VVGFDNVRVDHLLAIIFKQRQGQFMQGGIRHRCGAFNPVGFKIGKHCLQLRPGQHDVVACLV